MRGSDIETTTTTTICEERRAGHGRCPTWFRLLLRSSPPSPASRLRALVFFFFFSSLRCSGAVTTHEKTAVGPSPPARGARKRAAKKSGSACLVPYQLELFYRSWTIGSVGYQWICFFLFFMNNVRLLRFVYRVFWIIFFLKEISIFEKI